MNFLDELFCFMIQFTKFDDGYEKFYLMSRKFEIIYFLKKVQPVVPQSLAVYRLKSLSGAFVALRSRCE